MSRRQFVSIICHCTAYAKIAGTVCLQSLSPPPAGVTNTHCRLCSAWHGVWQFKLRSSHLQGKHFPWLPLAGVSTLGVLHPFSPRAQKEGLPRLRSHSHRRFTPHLHLPRPSAALVLPIVLCDSPGPNPTVLCLPLPVCFPPTLCPAHFPGCRGPLKLTGSEAFAFHFPGLFRSHLQFF